MATWVGGIVQTFGEFVSFLANFAVLGYILKGTKFSGWTKAIFGFFGGWIGWMSRLAVAFAVAHPIGAAIAVLGASLLLFWDQIKSIAKWVFFLPGRLANRVMGFFGFPTVNPQGPSTVNPLDTQQGLSWLDTLTHMLNYPINTLVDPLGVSGATPTGSFDQSTAIHKETHVGSVTNYITSPDPNLAGDSVPKSFENMVEDYDDTIER